MSTAPQMIRRDSGFEDTFQINLNKHADFFSISLEEAFPKVSHDEIKLPSYHKRTDFFLIKSSSCSFEITADQENFSEFNAKFEKIQCESSYDFDDFWKSPLDFWLKPVPFEKRIVPYYGNKPSLKSSITKRTSCSFFVELE
ncbi:3831_t:CDS:1 [Acaulospora morrowiae]|uniref:3831_t:CDS:1 n=1 Tax=Acaulospora morrowiae TaxID=94023 RepID=A0A9N8YYW1_9GLOM|nr:3831_t:CDS:1 [Acaulospora morrowiae]